MSGGSSIPYGNVKNMFAFSVPPSGGSVSSTSVYIVGTYGTVVSFNVPGVLVGDVILDINRPSNTISGNASPAAPYIGMGNQWVYAAGNISAVITNSSVIAYVTTPIENYQIVVARPEGTNPPTTTPLGVY